MAEGPRLGVALWSDHARSANRGVLHAEELEAVHTLQKPSISMPVKTDPCFVGVFHTLNQRRAQLYH